MIAPLALHPASNVAIYPALRPKADGPALMREEDVKALRPDIKAAKVVDLVRSMVDEEVDEGHEEDVSAHPRRVKRQRLDPPAPSFTKLLKEILTCEVCFMVYHEPMTLLCGHVSRSERSGKPSSFANVAPLQTFCAKCLQRTLDQDSKCPICRALLGAEIRFTLNMLGLQDREAPTNKFLLGISTWSNALSCRTLIDTQSTL